MRRAALLSAALLVGLGLVVPAVAEKPQPAPPRVTITSPRGGQTSDRVVSITGKVEGIASKRLTLVLNGVALSIPRKGEAFASQQVLAPGWNSIRVRGEAGARSAEDEVAVFARVPRKDMRIAMTWDTPKTDIDLWVTGPDGEKIFYSHTQGAQGGTLDVDVTTGYGPETYTQARAVRGTYRVQAHYYGSGPPTRVTVNVIRGEGTTRERRRELKGILMRKGEVLEVGTFHVE